MSQSSRQVAEHVTFQTFANCYLREIDAGAATKHRSPGGAVVDCIEWDLPTQDMALRAEVLSRSLCGPHRFGQISIRRSPDLGWCGVEPLSALYSLIHETYRQFGKGRAELLRGCELELLLRVLDSYQSIALYLDTAKNTAPDEADSFIGGEQSLLFGHWLHPTPKSRQGMTSWQQPSYAPELRGRFRLTYFAAKASLVAHDSARSAPVPEIVRSLAGHDADRFALAEDEVLLPMHPLQADALLLDKDIQALQAAGSLRLLGPAGPSFTATSSVRTVYSADTPWMLKFSLPVRITNSVRLNRRAELEAGVLMARLFERTGFCARYPQFKVIHDPAYLTLDLPGRPESGFEVIFRENPFVRGREGEGITVAALTADPVPGERSRLDRILRGLSKQSGATFADVSRRWFGDYLDCVLNPLMNLYDEYGVALEAHQQNSLLDVSRGYPRAYYYRDNQGFYLSSAYRSSLDALLPEAEGVASLYYDDDDIRDRFAYYLIVNQIFSVISRMGHDRLIEEEVLIGILRDRLNHFSRTMTGSGRSFARSFLDCPTIASKANLVTRLFDIDELEAKDERAVYTRLPNPLLTLAPANAEGTDCAVAS
ncbi:IucA/IucC family protein [Flaviflagellibacter deserti]|uniref:IucA/IucC family protein n=1 Tax=Flaviflagellibacter deserti TaxID=2267266 RepID=A0ABV9YY98_9HYPH